MDVLQVNKYFFEFGGPERYMFEVAALLESRGDRVAYFAMRHPRNRDSPFARHFVSNVDYGPAGPLARLRSLPRTLGGTFYSFEARRRLAGLLDERRPDVAHVHSIYHQISPSVLSLLRRRGVPVVQTCHDYQLVCPAYHLYIHHRREICERCIGGGVHNVVVHRCLKRSVAVSALAGAAAWLHQATGIVTDNVDLWIAPSRFLAGRLVAGGLPAERVRYLHNYIDLRGYRPGSAAGGHVVYCGRLSPEKGIDTLIRAVGRVPALRLVVVGEGEERRRLQRLAEAQAPGRVEFAGYRSGDELKALVRDAALLALPSEWYENCPMVILEAYALGTPVVASDIGGIPESVDDGVTGRLFRAGDADALADALADATSDPARLADMGRAGRRKVETSCAAHYDALTALYREARERR